LQEKNLSPHTIRYYLTTLAKFPGEITTDKLRNYFRQNINQYDPTSLHVQKNALHSYIKFQKLPIDWEKLARIIPSSQRKYFATIDEQDLTKLKTAKVEKNPRIYERNNLLLDFCFIVVCGLTN
jgi:integrase